MGELNFLFTYMAPHASFLRLKSKYRSITMKNNTTGFGHSAQYNSILEQNMDECPFFDKLHEWFGKNPGIHIKPFSSVTGKNLAALARKIAPGSKRASTEPPLPCIHPPAQLVYRMHDTPIVARPSSTLPPCLTPTIPTIIPMALTT